VAEPPIFSRFANQPTFFVILQTYHHAAEADPPFLEIPLRLLPLPGSTMMMVLYFPLNGMFVPISFRTGSAGWHASERCLLILRLSYDSVPLDEDVSSCFVIP
jgi:hypothetical protein